MRVIVEIHWASPVLVSSPSSLALTAKGLSGRLNEYQISPVRRAFRARLASIVSWLVMIRDRLIPLLKEIYPDADWKSGESPDPIATFNAIHPDVGDLNIWDHGQEATIAIGTLTHGHFNPYEPEYSQDKIDEEVTEDVLEFLNSVFSDKVLIWKSKDESRGGWQRLDLGGEVRQFKDDEEYYVWSGPYSDDSAS